MPMLENLPRKQWGRNAFRSADGRIWKIGKSEFRGPKDGRPTYWEIELWDDRWGGGFTIEEIAGPQLRLRDAVAVLREHVA